VIGNSDTVRSFMIFIPHQLVGVMKPRNMRLHHVLAHVEENRYTHRVLGYGGNT
jgi:hypothetical protein